MQFDAGDGEHGAFVEEAKKLMQQDDDDEKPNQDAPAAGGGVKIVRKLGPQKKAPANSKDGGKQEQFAKKVGGVELPKPSGGGGSQGGFTENDIEFMKKAIQILC